MGIDLLLRRRMMLGEGGFSVSPLYKVRFSQGNLRYLTSNGTWAFEDNQWDYRQGFGYGTSGYNNGQVCYMPTSTSTDPNDYYKGDLVGTADWGYNAITNGGNTTNSWRTLTKDELSYLLFSRETNYRFAKCQLTWLNCQGLIIFPDDYDTNLTIPSLNNRSAAFSQFAIATQSDWNSGFGSKDCVFLRSENTTGNGWYWTSSYRASGSSQEGTGGTAGGYVLVFHQGYMDIDIHVYSPTNPYAIGENTSQQFFVRLVQDIN